MKRAFSLVFTFLLVAAAGPVRGDVVTDWNLTAIDVMKAARFGGNPAARTLAMVHVAIASINDMDLEHRNVRVWGGIHFRNSLDVGYDMGSKGAAYHIENSIKPVR